MPQRGVAKRPLFETSTKDDADGDTGSSSASHVIFPRNDDPSGDNLSPGIC